MDAADSQVNRKDKQTEPQFEREFLQNRRSNPFFLKT
jgi:hypothetical protein